MSKIAKLLALSVLFSLFIVAIVNPCSVSANTFWISVSDVQIYQTPNVGGQSNKCYYPDCVDEKSALYITAKFTANRDSGPPSQPNVIIYHKGDPINGEMGIWLNGSRRGSSATLTDGVGTVNLGRLDPGEYKVDIRLKRDTHFMFVQEYSASISIVDDCNHTEDSVSLCQQQNIDSLSWQLCNQLSGDNKRKCQNCLARQGGVWTAVGCIPTEVGSMIEVLLRIGLLIGGGISLLIILAGSFTLSTSQGDPKKTSEAKEMISSALIGLVFIIFSVSIFQLIGVQILRIPGFAN